MKTYYVCSKCGRTVEVGREVGWLAVRDPRHPGQMIVRCPEHITRYALRQAHLTEREIQDVLDTTRDDHDAYKR